MSFHGYKWHRNAASDVAHAYVDSVYPVCASGRCNTRCDEDLYGKRSRLSGGRPCVRCVKYLNAAIGGALVALRELGISDE